MNTKIVNLKDSFVEQGREFYDATVQKQVELLQIQMQVSNPQ